jgi:hypothetical protein
VQQDAEIDHPAMFSVIFRIRRLAVRLPSLEHPPQPLRGLAVPIAAEDPVTQPSKAGRSPHSNSRSHSWPFSVGGNFFLQDTASEKTPAHLCRLPEEPTQPIPLS